MKLHVSKDLDELSDIVASWLVNYAGEVLAKRNRFTIALSGGNTPKRLYQQLASEKYRSKIDWKLVHVFWGDERGVPFNDKSNNAKMAFDEMLSQLPIPKDQVHMMQTDIDPMDAAANYQNLLHNYFDKQLYTFDLVLLGLGDNSHTLSLFPGYDDIVFDKENWVRAFFLKEQEMERITLTSSVVNAAGKIAFLVTGKDKSEALRQVITGKYDPVNHPAQIIKPLNDELYWFIDIPASAGLQHII